MEANLCLGFLYIFIMKLHLRRTMAKNCCSFPFSSSSLICNGLANCLLCFLIITINLNEMKLKWLTRILYQRKHDKIFVFFFQCKHFSFNQLTISIANNFSIMLIIYLYIFFFQFACISLVYLSIYIDDFSNNFETIVEATL